MMPRNGRDKFGGADERALSADERLRYSRHLLLPDVGAEGQQRLRSARVLVVGAGGLGSPVLLYLAAAGVGTLGIVENDVVDLSNLQRQVLYDTDDVGTSKLDAARRRVEAINPHVQVHTHTEWLTSANALDLVRAYDVVVDGTDNFAARYLVNDACVLTNTPNVHGSVFQFDGQASVFATADGPCYRCLYPAPPPPGLVQNCAEGGVFGVLPGLIGMIQSVETLKLLLGLGNSLAGRLLMVDALAMQFRSVRIQRDPNCVACGTRTLTALIDYDEFCGIPASSTLVEVPLMSTETLAAQLAGAEPPVVIDVREPVEAEESSIPGSRLIPLGTLASALDTLDRERAMVLVCRSGKRSADAVRQLQSAGFTRVHSLAGGMLAWPF